MSRGMITRCPRNRNQFGGGDAVNLHHLPAHGLSDREGRESPLHSPGNGVKLTMDIEIIAWSFPGVKNRDNFKTFAFSW